MNNKKKTISLYKWYNASFYREEERNHSRSRWLRFQVTCFMELTVSCLYSNDIQTFLFFTTVPISATTEFYYSQWQKDQVQGNRVTSFEVSYDWISPKFPQSIWILLNFFKTKSGRKYFCKFIIIYLFQLPISTNAGVL